MRIEAAARSEVCNACERQGKARFTERFQIQSIGSARALAA